MTQMIILEPLSAEETRRREELEEQIAAGVRAFRRMIAALNEMRESRLYRSTHPTWDAYCREVWNFSAERARQLTHAHTWLEQMNLDAPNERQVRALKFAFKEALENFPETDQMTILKVANGYAAKDGRGVTPADVRAAGRVLSMAMRTGTVDTADDTATPIDAAITREVYESMMQQKGHIAETNAKKGKSFTRFIAPLSALGGGEVTFTVGSIPLDELKAGETYEVTIRSTGGNHAAA